MKITYNWLKDFVDIKIPAKALADKLTMAGLEVTSLEERDGDYVFEIEITSNRPDWLSVVGVAREVAAITNSKMKLSRVKSPRPTTHDPRSISITIENKKDCPLYTAKIIRGVKVGPSPDWIKKRLELVGCRSVNNIVDITNYVLFERGEPLHAFDLDKISGGEIIVRRGKAGEKIVTIDKTERRLDKEILVIAGKDNPIAVAGVMGGEATEVTGSTKNILLEAAVFDPVLVRSGRQKLRLQSESSYRFERGVDPETAYNASGHAQNLIREICGGEPVYAQEKGPVKNYVKTLTLSLDDISRIIGVAIPVSKIKSILTKLGFLVRPKGKRALIISAPGHRQDIAQEVDLIEEIVRIYGYENIPVTLPKINPYVDNSDNARNRNLVSAIKNILVGLGLDEVITYSLIDRAMAKECAPGIEPVSVLNPLNSEQGVLRSTVIPGLLQSVSVNLNQKQLYVAIFEFSNIFLGPVEDLREELVLGIALCGIKSNFSADQGLIRQQAGVLHLKGILEILFLRLGITGYAFKDESGCLEFDVFTGNELIGKITKVKNSTLEMFEIKNKDVVVLEINLNKVFPYAKTQKKFTPLPLYPEIARDISVVVKDDIKVDELLKAAGERGGSLLESARISDYYKGKQIPQGFKGLTISCTYRSSQRTLTESEVNPVHTLVCAVLKDRFGAQLR